MLLSTAHFPPIQFFSKIIDLDSFHLESKEHYQSRSYRNRFIVSGANGPIRLSIPILKSLPTELLIKEVKIDPSKQWRKIHQKTIKSAYRHSPFYEYFIDEFQPYWEKSWKYLYDFNLDILNTIIKILELDIDIIETTEYIEKPACKQTDLRDAIHPKLNWENDTEFKPKQYTQNFSDRYDFIPNLSIIDLIFQAGPDAVNIIKT